MASSFVFYKFKSQREPSRVAFDGTAISVWDLKKEIIAENKMGRGADFDFAIYNADTEEEYTNDYAMIPRSTSVLARRLPPTKPGHGNAQKYMVGTDESGGGGLQAGRGAAPDPRGGVGGGQKGGYSKEMFSKRFDGREDAKPAGPPGGSPTQGSSQVPVPGAGGDEASAMAAMFAATNSQWQQTQEQMANATPIYRNPPGGHNRPQHSSTGGGGGGGGGGAPGGGNRNFPNSHKPPPPGYICYRCGQKGHWIQDCPTNGDAAYDNRPRIKRTTGIPKSFLTEVAGPAAATEDVDPALTGGVKSGIMVTADGGFVVARPDNASWLAHRALTANLSASDVQNLAPTDPDLTCPICSKLLRDAVLTPCCNTSFCDECVSNQLLDNDMLCPECETRVKNLDKLKPDEDRRERCKTYVDEMVEASKARAEQEKKEREEEEERLKAAQEKAAAAAAAKAAEEGADAEGQEGGKGEETAVKQEDGVKQEGDEELFPAKPEEIINPRQRRVGEEPAPAPPSADMAKTASSSSATPGSAPSAASPPRAASGTPAPAPNGLPAVPVGMGAAAQAQMLRQQQMMMQQQQGGGGMGMNGMNGGMGGGGMQQGMPTPQMVQQQMFQLSTMLQNPALPPPMRMQMQAQLQQCQMMMMQFQRQIAMAANGGGMGGMGGGMGMRQGMQGMQGMNAPKGPAAMQQGMAGGQKRGREDEGTGPAAKK
ncbi:hypothetical protein JCM6882_007156 [Rhodosporidiobolus microsporus]